MGWGNNRYTLLTPISLTDPYFTFDQAEGEIVVCDVGGVDVPFASPELLWKMKRVTHRAKDEADMVFLRQYFAELGQEAPA